MNDEECNKSVKTIKFICNYYIENNNGYGNNSNYRGATNIFGLTTNEVHYILTKGGAIHNQHTENLNKILLYDKKLLQLGLKAYNNIYN